MVRPEWQIPTAQYLVKLKGGDVSMADPVILIEPTGRTVSEGETVNFFPVIRSAQCVSYQWQRNGKDVAGTEQRSLTLEDVRVADAGEYILLIKHARGILKSRPAVLTINAAHVRPGGVDLDFNPRTALSEIAGLAVQPDGKILIAGRDIFVSGLSLSSVVRLHRDGRVDDTFSTGKAELNLGGASIRTIALQADGKILAGGAFTSFAGAARGGLVRLHSDGKLDEQFVPAAGLARSGTTPTYWVFALAIQPDDKILVGGMYEVRSGVPRTPLARLNPDGSLDETFQFNSLGDFTHLKERESYIIHAIALQNDGKIIVGGNFTRIDNTPAFQIARLHQSGRLDSTFVSDPGVSGIYDRQVQSIAIQPDGRIIIGGQFSQVRGAQRSHVARLHPDGTLDQTFGSKAAFDEYFQAMALQPDGKLLVGTRYSLGDYRFVTRLFRLHSNGERDIAFSPEPEFGGGSVFAITTDSDGGVLTAGSFGQVNNIPRQLIARFHGADFMESPRVVAVKRVNQTVSIDFPTFSGKTYHLEFTDTLVPAKWTEVAVISGDGVIQTLTDRDAVSSVRFYRVRAE